ncbi:MAG: c-type cytochrome [Burkholderiales bacterium]
MALLKTIFTLGAGALILGLMPAAFAADVDAAAAEALARKSGCLKCHSTTRDKEGPSYKSVAEKYKGKADAQQKLVQFLSTESKVKVDGKEEIHKALDTKNEADVRNVVGWILTR